MKKIVFPALLLVCFGCLSNDNNDPEIGDLADDLLLDDYDSIVIEIDYQSGAAPNVSSLTFLKQKIALLTNKSVQISLDDEIPDEDIQNDYSDIKELSNPIHKKYRDFHGNKTTISIYVVFIDGSYLLNENVMGTAYEYDSFIIFNHIFGIINDAGNSYYEILAERYILLHEFGHILGLSKWDEDGDNHCNNSSCVMHESFQVYINYTYFVQNFINGDPEFCNECYLELDKKRK